MKKCWKDEEAVSPVIATILMVAITVVLTSVLYVMVIGLGNTNTDVTSEAPLGLVQQDKNSTVVTFVVAIAPTTSLIWGTEIALAHNGVPGQANATVYHPNGTWAASYANQEWTINNNNNETRFKNGMTIQIIAPAITHGDDITFSGIGYGLTIHYVN